MFVLDKKKKFTSIHDFFCVRENSHSSTHIHQIFIKSFLRVESVLVVQGYDAG